MKTLKKVKLIENAIDAIMNVACDIKESDAGYLMNYTNSVVSQLRNLQWKIENN